MAMSKTELSGRILGNVLIETLINSSIFVMNAGAAFENCLSSVLLLCVFQTVKFAY